VEACEQYGVIPIIAYQADEYKKDPSAGNEKEVVNWWVAVAHYFGQRSPLLGFDLIYDPSDKLNHNQASLNRVYDKTIRTIHAIDPQRMIFIAPKLHAAPEDLANLKLPPQSQNTVLAQWHIFPWGPLKNNGKYPWTSGTVRDCGRKGRHSRPYQYCHSLATENRACQLGRGLVAGRNRQKRAFCLANGVCPLYGVRAEKSENSLCYQCGYAVL